MNRIATIATAKKTAEAYLVSIGRPYLGDDLDHIYLSSIQSDVRYIRERPDDYTDARLMAVFADAKALLAEQTVDVATRLSCWRRHGLSYDGRENRERRILRDCVALLESVVRDRVREHEKTARAMRKALRA
tara:strand:+ start:367 stop:762 length:396 start_codon:yes stop_codon:yes gene_type:complete